MHRRERLREENPENYGGRDMDQTAHSSAVVEPRMSTAEMVRRMGFNPHEAHLSLQGLDIEEDAFVMSTGQELDDDDLPPTPEELFFLETAELPDDQVDEFLAAHGIVDAGAEEPDGDLQDSPAEGQKDSARKAPVSPELGEEDEANG